MNVINSLLKLNLLGETKLFNGLIDLMKPRVMSLVIFTCAVGLLTAPNHISLFDAVISIGFVTLGAGAAGAATAWNLSKTNFKITCLDQGPLLKKEDY